MSKRVVAIVLTILLLVAPIEEPLFCREIKAAEIGMVGSLPGSVTLWEIFQTIFAAAGIIVANDNVQSAASANLGSSAYTLEEMERLGFIRIPTDGSSALDWDWSGLENQLESDTTNADTKIIKGVFGQNGGQGSGGSDEDPDEDPWYKKAVNWVKNAVVEGKIKLTNEISNGADSVTYSLSALAAMIGAAYNKNVLFGKPITTTMASWYDDNTLDYYIAYSSYYNQYQVKYNSNNFDWVILQSRGEDNSNFDHYWTSFLNTGTEESTIYVYRNGTNIRTKKVMPGEWSFSLTDTVISETDYAAVVMGNSVPKFTCTPDQRESEMIRIRNMYLNGESFNVVQSPDVITPQGNAIIPSGSPSWVPTPYLDPNTEMEIIPQPKIDEFTQYIIEEVPERAPAGEAWIDTVNPYVGIEPTPAPTQRPQPTQKPDVTKIPNADPGGEDNPINVTNPDPMPVIEGGFATTYGLMDFFPFCIPSDIVTIYKLFETEQDARAAPYIDWNLKIDRFGIDEHIVLDFSIFDSSAEVCRILMFITFCFGLLLATKQLIWS